MFVVVKLKEEYDIGTIVEYNDLNSYWEKSSSSVERIGVVESSEQDVVTLEWWGKVRFSGSCFAIADREIPSGGGNMAVLNGKVFVDNSVNSVGFISPIGRGQNNRIANDLVLLNIR